MGRSDVRLPGVRRYHITRVHHDVHYRKCFCPTFAWFSPANRSRVKCTHGIVIAIGGVALALARKISSKNA